MDDANKFDLLLTDVVLPGAIDGPSIAKEAHERDPSLKIVYMSDHIKDFKLDYSGGRDGNKFHSKTLLLYPVEFQAQIKLRAVRCGMISQALSLPVDAAGLGPA